MISHYLHYQFALLALLLKGDIDAATWRYAAWNRPIVVCGRTGSWVVDTPPEALKTTISQRALVQFFVGMLMVSGAVGWIAHAVERVGFAGALKEIGLPESDVPTALLTFNLGVEAGQLLIVGATLLVLQALKKWRPDWTQPTVRTATYAIGAVASMWLIERVF